MKTGFSTTATVFVSICLLLFIKDLQAIDDLPPGVPRVVNPDGSLFYIDIGFTTSEFQNEALRLVIKEANKAARDLQLHESLPILRTNLTHAFVSSFGYVCVRGGTIGNITTSNYWYGVERGYKFSDLTIANYDAYYVEYRSDKYLLPIQRMDTNAAYQLAAQWLTALHMDVKGLNQDCKLHIDLATEMNSSKRNDGKFTPLYYIWWEPKGGRYQVGGASVELYLPTKTLLQLSVDDPKYILRPPIVFTNLAALFPGKAAITTNKPVPLQYISAPSQ